MLGAVRLNTVNACNRPVIKEAVECLKNLKKGFRLLCQSCNKIKRDTAPIPAPKSGYVVWKYKNVVNFYTMISH